MIRTFLNQAFPWDHTKSLARAELVCHIADPSIWLDEITFCKSTLRQHIVLTICLWERNAIYLIYNVFLFLASAMISILSNFFKSRLGNEVSRLFIPLLVNIRPLCYKTSVLLYLVSDEFL